MLSPAPSEEPSFQLQSWSQQQFRNPLFQPPTRGNPLCGLFTSDLLAFAQTYGIGSFPLCELHHSLQPLSCCPAYWPLSVVAHRPCSTYLNTFPRALPRSAGDIMEHLKSHAAAEAPLALQSDLSLHINSSGAPGTISYVLWACFLFWKMGILFSSCCVAEKYYLRST